jgi:peptidyl-prolyl cis-trans isomerase A (cyclophilin A)
MLDKLCRTIRQLAAAGVVAAAATSVAAQDKAAPPRVLLATSLGDITVQLDPEKAPKTVANFLDYVKSGHYDGTVFHRVMDGFMIQGGGFTADMAQKPTRAPIPLEAKNGLKNERGTVAMARTAVADSATSQFFINVVDNPRLDYPSPDGNGYAVFGRVVAGMDVVDKIRKVETGNKGGHQNVPVTPVAIRSATIVK